MAYTKQLKNTFFKALALPRHQIRPLSILHDYFLKTTSQRIVTTTPSFQFLKPLPENQQTSIFLTCEHASNLLPHPWSWSKIELQLTKTHWAGSSTRALKISENSPVSVDIGSAALTSELSHKLLAPAILTRFSRLLIDPNRNLNSPTLFRLECDGIDIDLNANLSEFDKEFRIRRFYRPYRELIREVLSGDIFPNISFVLSVHSFTPVYEGQKRNVQVGVLYSDGDCSEIAVKFQEKFVSLNYDTRLNEPWPGALCDVLNDVKASGKKGIVIEFRQDLLSISEERKKFVNGIEDVLLSLSLKK